MLVEHIKQAIGETPEEEERDDERNWEYQLPSGKEASLDGGCVDRYTSSHGCLCLSAGDGVVGFEVAVNS